MLSSARKAAGITMCLLTWAAVPAGCGSNSGLDNGHGIFTTPPGAISVYQLAGQLRLRVGDCRRFSVCLSNRANSVTIFADPAGRVYVNSRQVRCPGPIPAVNGTLFVPEALAAYIRPHLRRAPVRTERPVPAPGPRRGVVVLDPGHGGRDPGAIARNGTYEKDVVLDIALKVRDRLVRRNVRVIMTRDDDRFVELNRRAAISNRHRPDLFVSIHADSASDRRVRGHTMYVAHGASSAAQAAARNLGRRMTAAGVHPRGIRRAGYRVLVRTTCPAVLVEVGYLSHRLEAALLGDADHRAAIAAAIAAGIVDSLGR